MKTIAEQMNITDFPFRMYDVKGNHVYYEDSLGYWGKWEYDDNQNLIYSEYSNGYWVKQEFDKEDNKIYCETSTGFWYKQDFDESCRLIYFENSSGYINDNRPPVKEVFTRNEVLPWDENLMNLITLSPTLDKINTRRFIRYTQNELENTMGRIFDKISNTPQFSTLLKALEQCEFTLSFKKDG